MQSLASASSTFRGAALSTRQAASSTGRYVAVVEAKVQTRQEKRDKRHKRVRNKVSGTPERPRLAVFRSHQHIYAQVIDDVAGMTLASASTLAMKAENGATVDAAKAVGKLIAEACAAKGITKVSYDRGGFLYHGRVEAVADAAREGGLVF